MQDSGFIGTTARWLLRRLRRLLVLVVSTGLALVLGFTLYAVTMLPDLQPWHLKRLDAEFSALTDRSVDFAGYLELEERLFREARAEFSGWAALGEIFAYSRFNSAANVQKLAAGAPYNRTFRLTPRERVGGALLVHGLTDSPYSMKALAESLHARGVEVTVLRLPGHGTLPSMMIEMRYRDWVAAVRLAARDVAARTGSGQPFYIGGYSTGATLALNHALDALTEDGLRVPDRILLVSPAIELTRVAALANLVDVMSIVPIPVLEKVRWQGIRPEFDPYKFNSFPVNASRQVNRAVRELQYRLTTAAADGRLARLAPVMAWQSAVDATVGSSGTVDLLYPQLPGGRHRLVLFDVNRFRGFSAVQRPEARLVIERAIANHPGYILEVVSNASHDSQDVALERYPPGSASGVTEPLGLRWPDDVISLGHVALPFPPDDPVYGFMPGSGHDGLPSLGSLLFRGENGATTISLGAFTRLRSNPFWSLVDRQVGEMVTEDLDADRVENR
ncbi:MAG: alpha/beta fold hydrolase [Gammaproteobacteria bacterium]|nr:alpha/beta fold hydrolase [Gammaproteobacteria bacterium]